nr:nucleoside hydrolase-like domain-containing protein [uncultured Draconibacterium sp.]
MKNLIITVFLVFFAFAFQLNAQQKPRTIVTTDGEVDDMDSFIRFLLYTNNLDIEGLVYCSSQWHYKGDGKGTAFVSEMEMTKRIYGERTDLRWPGTTWMQELIDKYSVVYPNLIQHDPDNDKLNYKWWNYTEVGTYPKAVEVKSAAQKQVKIRIPADAQAGETIHMILEVSDEEYA